MKNKIKSFSFWTALSGAVVVLLNALGQAFGFYVNNEIVSDIIMAIAGLLVVFGVVSMPNNNQDNSNSTENDAIEDLENKDIENNIDDIGQDIEKEEQIKIEENIDKEI